MSSVEQQREWFTLKKKKKKIDFILNLHKNGNHCAIHHFPQQLGNWLQAPPQSFFSSRNMLGVSFWLGKEA